MSKKIKVMLIDDNRLDLFINKAFIKQMNFAHSILEYPFATEALKFLQEYDDSHWPDLILLDIHMPIMNGFAFLDEYVALPKASRQKCKIVIVSSSLDPNDREKAAKNPDVLYMLEKPLNYHKLMQLLEKENIIEAVNDIVE